MLRRQLYERSEDDGRAQGEDAGSSGLFEDGPRGVRECVAYLLDFFIMDGSGASIDGKASSPSSWCELSSTASCSPKKLGEWHGHAGGYRRSDAKWEGRKEGRVDYLTGGKREKEPRLRVHACPLLGRAAATLAP